MKRTILAISVAGLVILGLVAVRCQHTPKISGQPATQVGTTAAHNEILAAYGKLPLSFEQNSGQTDPRVKFLAHGGGYTVFLTEQEATLRLELRTRDDKRPLGGPVSAASSEKTPSAVVRFALAGSNPHPKVQGVELQPGHSNYFVGNDPAKWRRNVSQFARVKFDRVYPGVDLIYYGNQGRLESDYIVAPGADARQIALRVKGADSLKVNSDGDAILSTAAGEVTLHQPRAYQEADGARREIAANYVQRGPGLIGIQVGPYDSRQTLVIDPVVGYATFLSGATGATFGNGIAADSTGAAYIVGFTTATDFPVTSGAFQKTTNNKSAGNAYITKLNGNGTALVFSTYLGGSGQVSRGDVASAVAVDGGGNVLVCGGTPSTDFPIISGNAFQVVNNGIPENAWLAKLDPTGSTLLYSTYIGGSGDDSCNAIALDVNGNAYMTGLASSTNFPTTPATAIQTVGKSFGSAFVTRIDTTKSGVGSLVYSTLLGGSSADVGKGIAVDTNLNAYITGETSSTDFPITATKAFQTAIKGTSGNGFVAKIDTTTSNNLVYSTYLGGTATNNPGQTGFGDFGAGIALDQNFNAYVIGSTESADFPVTAGAFQTTPKNTKQTVFVARLDTTKTLASSLIYSTFLGGSLFDTPGGIAVDSVGNAYLVGSTESPDFPTLPGGPLTTRTTFNRNLIFVSVLDPTGANLTFSTYYGGNNGDSGSAIALDSRTTPNLYITGLTASNDFPVTTGAFQTTFKTGGAYVVKLSPVAAMGVFTAPTSLNFGNQTVKTPSVPQTLQLANLTKSTLTGIAISFTGTNAADFTKGNSTCGTSLAVGATCTIGVIFTPSTKAAESATLSIADSDPSSPQTVPLTGTGIAAASLVTLAPATLTFGSQNINTTSTAQTVTLTNGSATTLTGIAISFTGSSSTSFAQTTTCGTTLAAGANCTISVTFTPTVAAAATASLSVTDSDLSSPQTVALTGTGITTTPDFSLAVSPQTASTAAGGTANVTVTVTGLNGFTTPVTLNCTGAPVDSSCKLTPGSLTPTASGATSTAAIVTATRTTGAMAVPPPGLLPRGPWNPAAPLWLVAFAMVLLAAWVVRRQSVTRRLAWTFAALLALSQTGCSGLPRRGTPAGVYTLTITGTAGTLTHQVTVSLTVT